MITKPNQTKQKCLLAPNQLTSHSYQDLISEAYKSDVSNNLLIGQNRAKDALAFGLGLNMPGYNLFVMGEQASGRYTLVHEYLKQQNLSSGQMFDWCYVNNLKDERRPIALPLPCGESAQLTKDIENFIDEILATFPAVFDNPGYQRKNAAITRHYEQKYDAAIDQVEREAMEQGIALIEEGNAISFAPIVDGKAMTDAELVQRTDIDKQAFYDAIDKLEQTLGEALIELPIWQRESVEKQKALKQETVEQAIRPLLKELEHKYKDNIAILRYLRQLKSHVIDMVIETLVVDAKDDKSDEFDKRGLFIDTYAPNVLVSNQASDPAPIVYESNPSYQNLFGKIEYTSVQGSVYTNYRMITAGALHRANSGYLILDADKVLEQPHVWEALKQALKFENIRLELPHQDVGMVNSITQIPEPIPLNVKIILLGSSQLYYALQDYDPEFKELFRVLVDFESEIEINSRNVNQFVARARSHAQQIGLDDIDVDAMSELMKYSLVQCEHQTKFSAKYADVIELINEAHYFNQLKNPQPTLSKQCIIDALTAKKQRSGRVSDTFIEDISEGHVLISTEGFDIGTLNGLTVLEVGDTSFGTPARITASVYAGSNGVVDIEREVELGQSIHSKGVLLLSGYLGNKYAQDFPLTLSANIALEQSYGYIDGDSASLAELLALISSLTQTPLNQGIAVTGSINQLGEVQAVGGINEKIEGYFELCRNRGLNGSQGVIIPMSNQINLMLNDRVIDAVEQQKFSIYVVSHVDDAIEIITESKAGNINNKGKYTKNTVHHLAISRLKEISTVVNGSVEE